MEVVPGVVFLAALIWLVVSALDGSPSFRAYTAVVGAQIFSMIIFSDQRGRSVREAAAIVAINALMLWMVWIMLKAGVTP